MTKPHEESWFTKFRGTGVELLREGVAVEDEDLPLIARSFEQRSADMQLERMDLAAAAPDMARALIEMSCRWDSEWAAWSCRCCGASGGSWVEGDVPPIPEPFEHQATCALQVALRKAGVR